MLQTMLCVVVAMLALALPLAAHVPADGAAQRLQHEIASSIAQGMAAYDMPPGDFYFNDDPLVVRGARNFVLRGDDTRLAFRVDGGVLVEDCSNVNISGIRIDYVPLPYVRGRVVQVQPSPHGGRVTAHVNISGGSLTPEELIAQYAPVDTWPPIAVFDQDFRLRCSPCGWGQAPPTKQVSSGVYEWEVCPATAAVGDYVAAGTRRGFSYLLVNSSNVLTENIAVLASPYMGFVEANGECGNTYRNVRIAPDFFVGLPLGANADGFHSTNCRRGPVLENSVLQNLNDDFFNVHNTMQLLVQASGSSALVADMQLFPGPRNRAYGTFETWPYVRPQDQVSFFAVNALDAAVASATVASASLIAHPTPAQLALFNSTYAAIAKEGKGCPLNACGAGLRGLGAVQLYAVTFAAPLPAAVGANMLVNVDSISNAAAIIRNNTFNSTSCNFGRFKSPNGSICANRFVGNTCHNNLEVGPLQEFLEGRPAITGVRIEDCEFHGFDESPIHTFAAQIEASNNTWTPTRL